MDEATEFFDAQMRAAMPANELTQVWIAIQQEAGAFRSIDGVRTAEEGGYTSALVRTRFADTTLDVKLTFDRTGQIAGMHLIPTP